MRTLLALLATLSTVACTAKPQAQKPVPVAASSLSLVSARTPVNAAPKTVTLYSSTSHFKLVPGIVTHGSRSAKRVALTFDADMTPGMERALDTKRVKSYDNTRIYQILEKTQTKATFFLSGMWIERYPQETKHLAENPLFELENHSYSHPGFEQPCYGLSKIAQVQKIGQLEQTRALLKKVAGVENHYFRFPGGCANTGDVRMADQLGLEVVGWDAAGQDGGQHNPQVIEHNILSRVQNGSIIVLHSHGGPKVRVTQDALPIIIATLKALGFEFVKLSELLEP